MSEKTKEITIATAILAMGLITQFYLIPTQVEVTGEFEIKSLSPAFFPEIAAWLLIILSAFLLLGGLTSLRSVEVPEADDSACQAEDLFTASDELRVWLAFLISIVYFFGLKYIGFLPATVLTMIGLFLLTGIRSPVKLVVMSVITTVSVYLFFHFVMKVYFPEALLFR